METTTKYEMMVAEYIHNRANKDHWPFKKPMDYLNHLVRQTRLKGKDFICVWLKDGEAFTKECGSPIEFVDVPHDCETIFRHQIEEAFYDATRPYQEIYC